MKVKEKNRLEGNGTTATKAKQETPIELPQIDIHVMKIRIIGDSPLISHAWSAKAIKMIEDKQAKVAKQGRDVRSPEEEVQASLYLNEKGKPGFPASGFKQAAVDACSHVQGITKVLARGAFHVCGHIIPLIGDYRRRDDMVRVGMGSADIRYRAEFPAWSVDLTIRYNKSVLSHQQIINLFNVAGFAIGVGDWRPQKDGSNGMFHVE